MPKNRSCPAYPLLWRMMSGLLVVLAGTLPAYSEAQGLLPSLDILPGAAMANNPITPITELTGAPNTDEKPAVSPNTINTPADDSLKPLSGHLKSGELTPLVMQPLHPQIRESMGAASEAAKPLHGETGQPEEKAAPAADFPPLTASHEQEPSLKGPTLQPLVEPAAPATSSTSPAATIPATPDLKQTPQPASAPQKKTADRPLNQAEPAAKPARKPFKFSMDVGQAIEKTKSVFDEKSIKPVSYSPLAGIIVFAVVKHGNERAFGDLPVMFAREYALRLGAKLPETKIYNPVYTVDELRIQGLGHIYDQIMNYYIKTGAPEPTAMDYLLKQISTNRPDISRVVFVEADVDMSHPDASTSLLERTQQLLTDGQPKQMKYFVVSHLQIFDAEKQGFPMVWSGSWQRSVPTNKFFNVTPSVYADSDSQDAFAKVSRQMSQEMLLVTPKKAYMEPVLSTDVEGKLVTGKQQPVFPNLPETQIVPKGLSHENKQAIERILQRQNGIGPQ